VYVDLVSCAPLLCQWVVVTAILCNTQVEILPGLVLISVNTQYCDSNNFWVCAPTDRVLLVDLQWCAGLLTACTVW
jgi:hypothetical protein